MNIKLGSRLIAGLVMAGAGALLTAMTLAATTPAQEAELPLASPAVMGHTSRPGVTATPSPTPAATTRPSPTPPAAVVAVNKASGPAAGTAATLGRQDQFLRHCGLKLCLGGQPFRVKGATTYGRLDDPAGEVELAKQAGLNVLEIVEYERDYHDLSEAQTEATWARVDNIIALAKLNKLHVILNFSSYGQSLEAAGQKPAAVDWGPFLRFVATRVNPKTGLAYADEPAIALVELYGEVDAPSYNAPGRSTTAETTAFYRRTLAQWKALDPNHLLSTGGFSYINDPGSGIDWKTISADPNNDVCGVEVNSYSDRNVSVPALASFCGSLGKPWFLAAWSSCYQTKWGLDDINNWLTDDDMAAHARDMYALAGGGAGSDFWNLGPDPVAKVGSCDLGPQFPLTLGVVKED